MRDLFDGQPPRLAVLSSLAAGADQIGARAALDVARAQETVAVEMEALLPFREEDYPGPPRKPRPEFTEHDARELRELVAVAKQVVRLDGDYSTHDGHVQAFREARDLLVQNSDILIAIYDPTASGSEAGTLETMKVALQLNTPVIAIQINQHEATIAVTSSLPFSKGDPHWQTIVEERVREQLVLPELLRPRPDSHSLDHALRRLHLVAQPANAPALCRNTVLATVFRWAWQGLRWLTLLIARPEAKEELRKALALKDPDDRITLDPYAALYEPASTLAEHFMRTYRGAFVLSYSLAGLAVAAAVAMMLAMILLHHPHPPLALTLTLCALKIVIIGSLLLLAAAGRQLRLHEAAVDFRYLSELLRPKQWLSPAGVYPPAVDLALHSASSDLRRSWMTWLVRAAARSSPSVSANMSEHPREITMTRNVAASVLDDAANDWIYGQVVYHARNRARMEALDDGIERWAKILLWTVLLAALEACALEWFHIAAEKAAVLSAIAAILPAFIAALIGIGFQSEAKRLARRSEAMCEALIEQQKELKSLAVSLRTGSAGHGDVTIILKKLSAITIVEAADWKILYEVHEVRAS